MLHLHLYIQDRIALQEVCFGIPARPETSQLPFRQVEKRSHLRKGPLNKYQTLQAVDQ